MIMKKNSLIYFLVFAILFAVSSCATDSHLKSRIVGVWKPVKIGSIDIQKLVPRDDTIAQKYTEDDKKMLLELKGSSSKPSAGGTPGKSTIKDFSQLINEANTTYKFTKEGLGARDNPQQPIKGTWKFKNKGTKLVITDERAQQEFVLQIDSLTSDKMVATNKNMPNGLKITYIKVR
jgi:hypothetical protein